MSHSKSASYGIWYPGISRVHVTVARGIHFSVMGHSAARPTPSKDDSTKLQKRLELLPEEAIYLVERGSLFCWKDIQAGLSDLGDVEGAPMTVQQAFSEMIGKEDLTLEKYQVIDITDLFLWGSLNLVLGLCILAAPGVCGHSHRCAEP